MLTLGDQFPSFSVAALTGGPAGRKLDSAFTEITATSDAGKWKIVVFWPEEFTFVCPTEIMAFGTLKGAFAAPDAVVYGGSTNSEFVHMNWRLHHDDLKNRPIPMLADVKRELSEALGVLSKSAGVPLRAAFIVDPVLLIQSGLSVLSRSMTGCRPQPAGSAARAGRAAK
jgi:peroxiredoxin (alkyl hydroperoxide reductase subunit C)